VRVATMSCTLHSIIGSRKFSIVGCDTPMRGLKCGVEAVA